MATHNVFAPEGYRGLTPISTGQWNTSDIALHAEIGKSQKRWSIGFDRLDQSLTTSPRNMVLLLCTAYIQDPSHLFQSVVPWPWPCRSKMQGLLTSILFRAKNSQLWRQAKIVVMTLLRRSMQRKRLCLLDELLRAVNHPEHCWRPGQFFPHAVFASSMFCIHLDGSQEACLDFADDLHKGFSLTGWLGIVWQLVSPPQSFWKRFHPAWMRQWQLSTSVSATFSDDGEGLLGHLSMS